MSSTDLGLRQRKSISKENSTSNVTQTTDAYVAALAEKLPASVRPLLFKAVPICQKALEMWEKALPFISLAVEKIQVFWKFLEPHRPELLFPAMIGIILCFFGGSFLTTIAAVEAYRMCGYETSLQCARDLYEDFNRFLAANKDDDQKDDNNDGVLDTLQISPQELITRKAFLFLKTVDPKRVTSALAGLNSGFLAVAATLKLQFAKAVTLGTAIGSIIEKPALHYALPLLVEVLPEEHKKWAAPLIDYTVKSIAISLAWMAQRVLGAFHSAVRGGLMFSRNILEYLCVMKYVEIDHKDTYIDEVAGYG